MAVAGTPWQLECESLEQRCGYLLTSAQWSDCTFVLGSETNQEVVPAHKLVLAMASPVFEAMFYGGLSEHNEPIVSIPDVPPEAFRALLQYIYTGNISIDSFSMACNLWYEAKKYMLPCLVKKCNSYLCTILHPSNACQIFEYAHLFDDKTLMDNSLEVMLPSSSDKSPAAELESKPSTEGVSSKQTKDKEEEPSIHTALQKIRFLSLSAEQFVEGPARSSLLTKDESYALVLNIASKDSPVPMPPGFSECRERRQARGDSQKQCFEAGRLDHTIHALKCGDPSQVTDAARAARNILCTPDDIQGALDKGILDALVPALTEGDDLCKYNAVCAIYYLCIQGSPSQLSVLAASAALEPYCRLMTSRWNNTCLLVMCGLTYLLKDVAENTKVALLRKLREIGVPQLLITAQQGGNADEREPAADLLRTYFDNEQ